MDQPSRPLPWKWIAGVVVAGFLFRSCLTCGSSPPPARVAAPAPAPPPAPAEPEGLTAAGVENICRAHIGQQFADVSWPGFRDFGVDQGPPVKIGPAGAVWRSWLRLRGVQRWFVCRYSKESDRVSAQFEDR